MSEVIAYEEFYIFCDNCYELCEVTITNPVLVGSDYRCQCSAPGIGFRKQDNAGGSSFQALCCAVSTLYTMINLYYKDGGVLFIRDVEGEKEKYYPLEFKAIFGVLDGCVKRSK